MYGAKSTTKKAQSAMEYLVTYSWAILIITIVVAILYFYYSIPTQIVSNSCTFVNGAYCTDFIIGTNTATHNTTLGFFLTNLQSYPLVNPKMYAHVGNSNSIAYDCSPHVVLPGGSMICVVNVSTSTSIGSFLSGSLYLNATNCGLSASSYLATHNCSKAVNQTYTGSFVGHAAGLVSTKSSITLTASNYTQSANGALDQLNATVTLLGYPLNGGTVNFTVNNTAFSVSPNMTNTNVKGVAVSDLSGNSAGGVLVTASYAGLSSSIVVKFIAPVYLIFVPKNFTYCSTSGAGTVATVDGVGYTCTQLSNKKFGYTKGTTHTYSFSNTVTVGASTRESFFNLLINGVPNTNLAGSIAITSNTIITFDYYPQFFFTETVSPSASAGTVTPGSNWYNLSTVVPITATSASGYIFTGWTCTGAGCYQGADPAANVIINGPIKQNADFFFPTTSTTSTSSTSTTSTSSTSTSSTSTSSTSTSSTSTSSTSTSSTSTSSTSSTSTSTTTTKKTTTSSTSSTSTSTTSTYVTLTVTVSVSSTSTTTTSSTSTSSSSTSSSSTSSSTSTTSSTTTTIQNYVYCPFTPANYAPLSASGIGAWTGTTAIPIQVPVSCTVDLDTMYCVDIGRAAGGTAAVYFAPVSSGGIGTWTGTLAYPYNDGPECTSASGYIYCVGGVEGTPQNIAYNASYAAPIADDGITAIAWTKTTDYPVNDINPSCVLTGGDMYCVAGEAGFGPQFASTAVYYTTASGGTLGSWKSTTSYPIALDNATCVTTDSNIYCVGGASSGTSYSNVYYAPLSGSGVGAWKSTTAYPIATSPASCVVSYGYVYCLGLTAGGSTTYYAPISASGVGTWLSTTNYPGTVLGGCQSDAPSS